MDWIEKEVNMNNQLSNSNDHDNLSWKKKMKEFFHIVTEVFALILMLIVLCLFVASAMKTTAKDMLELAALIMVGGLFYLIFE